MEYRKSEKEYYIRIDKGEEVLSTILELCRKENILSAYFQGIGACDKVICQTLDLSKNDFITHEKTGVLEMLSLLGNIAQKENGEPTIHAHGSFSYVENEEVKLFGGHMKEGHICYTGEIILTPTDLPIKRTNETGMNIWKFQ